MIRYRPRLFLATGLDAKTNLVIRDLFLQNEEISRHLNELSDRRYGAQYNWTPASLDTSFFTAERDYLIRSCTARVDVAGTDAGAVTAVIKMSPSGTAISGGTAIHSGSIDLKGAAATNQAMTISTTDAGLKLLSGYSLGIDFSGVLTAAVGSVTVHIMPT